MKTSIKLAAAGAGLAVLVRAVGRSRARPFAAGHGDETEPSNRWRAVTVNQPQEQIAPDGALPPPLADLGDVIEVRISKAAGGKGTELAARLRDPEPSGAAGLAGRLAGDDPGQAVRSALRESKQLIEAGEILRVEPQPTGRRASTPGSWLIGTVTRRAGSEGVL
ncbi:MAG TPA: hypothetical protein VGD68_05755 [Streptosporangiaceae bacterium]